MLSAQFARL